MKHIVIISSNYPSKAHPNYGIFVQQLVRAFARIDIKCKVISPMSTFDIRYGKLDPVRTYDYTINENPIEIIRPRYISFSNKQILSFNTVRLTQITFEQAVYKALLYLNPSPDILYGHFLYPSGAAALHLAHNLGIPSFVAFGEDSFWSVAPFGFKKAVSDFRSVSGIVSVSSLNEKKLVARLKIPRRKIGVFPNGVDLSLFYPRNRQKMRKKYGYPLDKFIIAFTGYFNEVKGPHRVLKAVSQIENIDIGLIFMGSGDIVLESEKILFKGIVKHSIVPEMFSAADIFVLPTLSEGSCNSIIEALACGLPIVSSKDEFNDDIIDNEIAIKVNPRNITQIRDAIIKLATDKNIYEEMSSKALEKSKKFDINLRAKKIIEWINFIINN